MEFVVSTTLISDACLIFLFICSHALCDRSVYVSYFELGVEVRDADKIWQNYVRRSSFWSDLMAALPFDALVLLVWHAYGGSLSALLSALLSGSSLSRHAGQMRGHRSHQKVANISIVIHVSSHTMRISKSIIRRHFFATLARIFLKTHCLTT